MPPRCCVVRRLPSISVGELSDELRAASVHGRWRIGARVDHQHRQDVSQRTPGDALERRVERLAFVERGNHDDVPKGSSKPADDLSFWFGVTGEVFIDSRDHRSARVDPIRLGRVCIATNDRTAAPCSYFRETRSLTAEGVPMFDSVLRPDFSQNRFGTGVVIAVAVHAVIAAAVATISRPNAKIVIPTPVWPTVKIHNLTPVGQVAKTEKSPPESHRTRPRDSFRVPRTMPAQLPTPAPEPTDVGDSNSAAPGLSQGTRDGIPGAILPGSQSMVAPALPALRIELDEGLVRLKKISGPDPEYTQKALDHEVEGNIVAKCAVTSHGWVERCRILSSLPFMDRAVIDALERRRYEPYRINGTPIEVDYTFRIKLNLPH